MCSWRTNCSRVARVVEVGDAEDRRAVARASSRCACSSTGASALHGSHQDANTLSTTTLPRKSARLSVAGRAEDRQRDASRPAPPGSCAARDGRVDRRAAPLIGHPEREQREQRHRHDQRDAGDHEAAHGRESNTRLIFGRLRWAADVPPGRRRRTPRFGASARESPVRTAAVALLTPGRRRFHSSLRGSVRWLSCDPGAIGHESRGRRVFPFESTLSRTSLPTPCRRTMPATPFAVHL